MPTLRAATRAPWGTAHAQASRVVSPFQPATPRAMRCRGSWSTALRSRSPVGVSWIVSATADAADRVTWDAYGTRHAPRSLVLWGVSATADQRAVMPWGQYAGRPRAAVESAWLVSATADRRTTAPWGFYVTRSLPLRAIFLGSSPRNPRWQLPWSRYSRLLPVGWGIPSPPGEQPGDNGGIVPTLRSYIVVNDVTLIRVSDAESIPTYGLQVSADADSWTFGWSATVKGSALALVEPATPGEPVELEAAINGDTFRLLVEEIARDRRFPRDRLQISGRGIAARLADPYAAQVTRSNTGALTAAQIAEDALTINAVPIGWTIDWGITDWLVPAGAWNHTGTHLEAVQAVANAAGAYLRSDRNFQTLYVRPRWPVLPWDLAAATPEITLPAAAVSREGVRWVERPDYNGVYVSGEAQGILAHIRRTGTLGDLLAPMATDQLITHDDAARQRGPAEIGFPGRSAMVTLDLQVLPATGVIVVGTILQFVDGATTRTGIVRSVSVTYSHPVLRQSVEIECHA